MPSIFELTQQKKTFATTYRGDIRSIATIAMYFRDKKEPIRNMADILGLAVESIKHLIVQGCPEYEIVNYHEAVHILEKLGVFNLEKDFRNKPTLLKELSIEDLNLGGGDPTYGQKTQTKNRQCNTPFGSEQQKNELLEKLSSKTDTPVHASSVEEIEDSIKRRELEEKETKQLLGTPPEEV